MDFCALILVDAEHIDSLEAFKPEHLGYIAHIFQDNSDSIYHICLIQKYKQFK